MIAATPILVALALVAQAQPEAPDAAIPLVAPEVAPDPAGEAAPDAAPATESEPEDFGPMIGERGSAVQPDRDLGAVPVDPLPVGPRGSDVQLRPGDGPEVFDTPVGPRGSDVPGAEPASGHGHDHHDGNGDVERSRVRARSAPPVDPKTDGHWRITIGGARQQIMAESNEWIGDSAQIEGFVSLERNLGDLIPVVRGLGVRTGLNFSQHVGDYVGVYFTELEIGASYHFPHDGLFDVIFPYAHLDFLAAWAAVETSGGLEGDSFVPGFGVTLGVRFLLPRMGLGQNFRLFGLFEGGWQLRAAVVPRLTLPPTHEDPEPEPPIPLGQLEMLGFNLRFGVGLEF